MNDFTDIRYVRCHRCNCGWTAEVMADSGHWGYAGGRPTLGDALTVAVRMARSEAEEVTDVP